MIEIKRNTTYTQAYGCRFCLQIGSTAIFFGSGVKGRGPRLELLTPRHWWRWSRGYRDKNVVETAENSRSYDLPLIYVYDMDGRLWKGRTHPEENLHWSRLEGFYPDWEPIWVLRATNPPDPFTPCVDIEKAIVQALKNHQQVGMTG